jgi:anti-sigma B factor antagonist
MSHDMHFEVLVSHASGMPVLEVGGEIDVASAPEFERSLSDFISKTPEIIVVDMSAVSFIDSTGLGVLVGAEAEVRENGKNLRLVVTQPHITKLLELTGLDAVFTVLSDTNDAVKT